MQTTPREVFSAQCSGHPPSCMNSSSYAQPEEAFGPLGGLTMALQNCVFCCEITISKGPLSQAGRRRPFPSCIAWSYRVSIAAVAI